MSQSRFVAFGLALLAGVTLESCASSGAFFPSTGPNPAVPSFPAARVRFVQGSPNLNLGITTVDLYIDNKFAGTFSYGAISNYIYTLPAGPHDFKLVQAGTLFPVFLENTLVLSAGNKYAVVAGGDAAVHSTTLFLFTVPKYNTPSGSVAASFFDASPRAPGASMLYNCIAPGPACKNGIGLNSILFHSVNDGWCFGAYVGGVLVPGPTSIPGGTDPNAGPCPSVLLVGTTAPNNNFDFFLVDDTVAAQSRLLFTGDQDG